MTPLLKWKCAASFALAAAAAGWTLYLTAEAPGTARGRTLPVRQGGTRATAETPGGSFVVKDSRTGNLLESLAEITSDAKAGQVSERFLKAVDTALLDSNYERRRRNFGLLMEHLRPEDAPELHKAFVRMHGEGRPYEEYSVFATRWGEIDGAGALAFLRSTGVPVEPRDFDEIMKGWGQVNPASAMQWLADNAEYAADFRGEPAVLRGWARENPAEATQWLLAHGNMDSDRLQQSVGALMLEQLYGQGLERTAQWLASLPDDETFTAASRAAWHMHLRRFESLRPEEAVTLWKSVGNEPWMQVREFQRFIGLAGRTPERNAEILSSLAQGGAGDVSGQFQRWAAADPTTTSEWLAANPQISPDFRREAIQGLVTALEKESPADAAEWRKQLAP